jgi:hypothetical protein
MDKSFSNFLYVTRRLLPLIAVCYMLDGTASFAGCNNADPDATEVTKLDWSTLQIPSGSTTYKVDGTSGAESGTGTQLYGTSARGQYTITKSSGNEATCSTFTIDVKNISCQAAGCTLGAFTGNYNGANLSGAPPWTVALPGAGKTLYLGATATYDGAVTAGAKTPTFDLALHYDGEADTTLSQSAAIGFDTALTIDTVVDINFGVVKALTAGDYTIDTSGAVSAANGGVLISGMPVAGSMKIHGSSTQAINISVGSYVAGGISNGVTLSNATCSYDGGAAAACSLSSQAAPTSTGKTLLLGVKATVDSSQTAGSSATPSFTVTVIYT